MNGLAFLIVMLPAVFAIAQEATRSQFERWDQDGDGAVTRAELPAALRRNFQRVDTDENGSISLAEHEAFLTRGSGRRNRIPENVTALLDVSYIPEGHERQKLDLYLPKDANHDLPLIIWIHGGGWRNGNRAPCPALFLTEHGYAVASLGYRLSGHAIFPAQIQDCKTAIRFLRSKAKEYQLDSNRFGVWGSSAGGHLVALVGTTGNTQEFDTHDDGLSQFECDVQAVCDYFGPTDLLQMAAQSGENSRIDHDHPDSPESLLMGGALQSKADLANRANPIHYVDSADPPFLIVHGDQDPLVPTEQSHLLHTALQKAQVPSQLTIVAGGGHGPFRNAEQLEAVHRFFDETLDHQTPADSLSR